MERSINALLAMATTSSHLVDIVLVCSMFLFWLSDHTHNFGFCLNAAFLLSFSVLPFLGISFQLSFSGTIFLGSCHCSRIVIIKVGSTRKQKKTAIKENQRRRPNLICVYLRISVMNSLARGRFLFPW